MSLATRHTLFPLLTINKIGVIKGMHRGTHDTKKERAWKKIKKMRRNPEERLMIDAKDPVII
jgi:hypothetical protein